MAKCNGVSSQGSKDSQDDPIRKDSAGRMLQHTSTQVVTKSPSAPASVGEDSLRTDVTFTLNSQSFAAYNDNVWIIFRMRGSVVPLSLLSTLPCALLAIALSICKDRVADFRKDYGIENFNQSVIWTSLTAVLAILLSFRTGQGYSRFWEGSGLLHQMRGEWFDAASCCVSFSRDSKLNKGMSTQADEFRHTLIRLMSLMHGVALDEISVDGNHYDVIDLNGLDTGTLQWLRECKSIHGLSQVEALQHLIQVLITHNHHSGVLSIPPPILSRVYQTLSRGLVHFLNARKIKDTLFPFPYAQSVKILLCAHSIMTPILMTGVVDHTVWSAVLSFLPVFGMFCINFIASQLEMPFGQDPNDLPLCYFQKEMNDVLVMLLHDKCDHLAHTSKYALTTFDELVKINRKSHSKAIPRKSVAEPRKSMSTMASTLSARPTTKRSPKSLRESSLKHHAAVSSSSGDNSESKQEEKKVIISDPEIHLLASSEFLEKKDVAASQGMPAASPATSSHLPPAAPSTALSSFSSTDLIHPLSSATVSMQGLFDSTLQEFSRLMGNLVDTEGRRIELLRKADHQLSELREHVASAERLDISRNSALFEFLRQNRAMLQDEVPMTQVIPPRSRSASRSHTKSGDDRRVVANIRPALSTPARSREKPVSGPQWDQRAMPLPPTLGRDTPSDELDFSSVP